MRYLNINEINDLLDKIEKINKDEIENFIISNFSDVDIKDFEFFMNHLKDYNIYKENTQLFENLAVKIRTDNIKESETNVVNYSEKQIKEGIEIVLNHTANDMNFSDAIMDVFKNPSADSFKSIERILKELNIHQYEGKEQELRLKYLENLNNNLEGMMDELNNLRPNTVKNESLSSELTYINRIKNFYDHINEDKKAEFVSLYIQKVNNPFFGNIILDNDYERTQEAFENLLLYYTWRLNLNNYTIENLNQSINDAKSAPESNVNSLSIDIMISDSQKILDIYNIIKKDNYKNLKEKINTLGIDKVKQILKAQIENELKEENVFNKRVILNYFENQYGNILLDAYNEELNLNVNNLTNEEATKKINEKLQILLQVQKFENISVSFINNIKIILNEIYSKDLLNNIDLSLFASQLSTKNLENLLNAFSTEIKKENNELDEYLRSTMESIKINGIYKRFEELLSSKDDISIIISGINNLSNDIKKILPADFSEIYSVQEMLMLIDKFNALNNTLRNTKTLKEIDKFLSDDFSLNVIQNNIYKIDPKLNIFKEAIKKRITDLITEDTSLFFVNLKNEELSPERKILACAQKLLEYKKYNNFILNNTSENNKDLALTSKPLLQEIAKQMTFLTKEERNFVIPDFLSVLSEKETEILSEQMYMFGIDDSIEDLKIDIDIQNAKNFVINITETIEKSTPDELKDILHEMINMDENSLGVDISKLGLNLQDLLDLTYAKIRAQELIFDKYVNNKQVTPESIISILSNCQNCYNKIYNKCGIKPEKHITNNIKAYMQDCIKYLAPFTILKQEIENCAKTGDLNKLQGYINEVEKMIKNKNILGSKDYLSQKIKCNDILNAAKEYVNILSWQKDKAKDGNRLLLDVKDFVNKYNKLLSPKFMKQFDDLENKVKEQSSKEVKDILSNIDYLPNIRNIKDSKKMIKEFKSARTLIEQLNEKYIESGNNYNKELFNEAKSKLFERCVNILNSEALSNHDTIITAALVDLYPKISKEDRKLFYNAVYKNDLEYDILDKLGKVLVNNKKVDQEYLEALYNSGISGKNILEVCRAIHCKVPEGIICDNIKKSDIYAGYVDKSNLNFLDQDKFENTFEKQKEVQLFQKSLNLPKKAMLTAKIIINDVNDRLEDTKEKVLNLITNMMGELKDSKDKKLDGIDERIDQCKKDIEKVYTGPERRKDRQNSQSITI